MDLTRVGVRALLQADMCAWGGFFHGEACLLTFSTLVSFHSRSSPSSLQAVALVFVISLVLRSVGTQSSSSTEDLSAYITGVGDAIYNATEIRGECDSTWDYCEGLFDVPDESLGGYYSTLGVMYTTTTAPTDVLKALGTDPTTNSIVSGLKKVAKGSGWDAAGVVGLQATGFSYSIAYEFHTQFSIDTSTSDYSVDQFTIDVQAAIAAVMGASSDAGWMDVR